MSPKIIDEVQDWLRGLRGKSNTPDKPRPAIYNGETVFVYSETADYVIISYNAEGTKMFSVKPEEVK